MPPISQLTAEKSDAYALAKALARIPPDETLPPSFVCQLTPRTLRQIADQRAIWATIRPL
jgi:hypothetical protein